MLTIDLDYRTYQLSDADGVKVDVRPLTVEANQACIRVVMRNLAASAATEKDKNAGTMALVMDAESLAVAKEVLPLHARNLVGITVREKGETRPATVEDLTAHAPLFGIALTILAHLMSISVLAEQESGN